MVSKKIEVGSAVLHSLVLKVMGSSMYRVLWVLLVAFASLSSFRAWLFLGKHAVPNETSSAFSLHLWSLDPSGSDYSERTCMESTGRHTRTDTWR
jgi:hypothetical protein